MCFAINFLRNEFIFYAPLSIWNISSPESSNIENFFLSWTTLKAKEESFLLSVGELSKNFENSGPKVFPTINDVPPINSIFINFLLSVSTLFIFYLI